MNSVISRWALLKKIRSWLRLKKLEGELRSSEKYVRYYRRIKCVRLAELEEVYRAELQEKIRKLQWGDPK